MTHALAAFIREQMDARGLRNRDVAAASGLSRQLVSKYASDTREQLNRLPDKATIAALAKAFNVDPGFLLGKAIEALGLGYTSGDFVNSVATATDRELLSEIEQRLRAREEVMGNAEHPAPTSVPGMIVGMRGSGKTASFITTYRAAREGVRQRSITDADQNAAGEESQDQDDFEPR